MSPRSTLAGTAAWIALTLAGCLDDTGTPCREGYQCFSGSCTFYSCDSPLSVSLANAINPLSPPPSAAASHSRLHGRELVSEHMRAATEPSGKKH
ncbi:MAG TPA: hypothetical protein VHM19_18675 [Polyangiales bacterium]|nr:hypothetical protein [Polyangiales bacterium]